MPMHFLVQLVALVLATFGGRGCPSAILVAGEPMRMSAPRVDPIVQPTVAPDGGGLAARYYGLDCDGTNDYANVAPSFALDTARPWTAMLWVRIAAFPPNYQGIAGFRTDQSTGFGVTITNNASGYEGVCFGSSANFVALKDGSPASFFTGTWRHVAIVYNGAGRTQADHYALYLDGTSRTLSASGAFSPVPNATYLARNQTIYTKGTIAQVRVWQAALSGADVRSEMRSTAPVRSTAILACAFRPGSGQFVSLAQAIRDESGNGYAVTRGASESIGDDDPTWTPAAGWTAIGANGPF